MRAQNTTGATLTVDPPLVIGGSSPLKPRYSQPILFVCQSKQPSGTVRPFSRTGSPNRRLARNHSSSHVGIRERLVEGSLRGCGKRGSKQEVDTIRFQQETVVTKDGLKHFAVVLRS